MEHLDDTFAVPATLILSDGGRYEGRAVVVEEHDVTTERGLVRGTFWFYREVPQSLAFGSDEEATVLLEGGRELAISMMGDASFTLTGTQPSWMDFLDRRNMRK